MAGSGELYKTTDGRWSFRVKSANGKVIAVDDPPGYKSKPEARSVLQRLLKGDYDGPIREPAAVTCGKEISDNNMLPGDPSMGRQDMGIRVEGPAANNNKPIGNTVTGERGRGHLHPAHLRRPCHAGCAGTPGNEGNEIIGNMSHRNGTSGQGRGSGSSPCLSPWPPPTPRSTTT